MSDRATVCLFGSLELTPEQEAQLREWTAGTDAYLVVSRDGEGKKTTKKRSKKADAKSKGKKAAAEGADPEALEALSAHNEQFAKEVVAILQQLQDRVVSVEAQYVEDATPEEETRELTAAQVKRARRLIKSGKFEGVEIDEGKKYDRLWVKRLERHCQMIIDDRTQAIASGYGGAQPRGRMNIGIK